MIEPFAPVMLGVTLKTGAAVGIPPGKSDMAGFKLSLARSTGGVPSVSPVSHLRRTRAYPSLCGRS